MATPPPDLSSHSGTSLLPPPDADVERSAGRQSDQEDSEEPRRCCRGGWWRCFRPARVRGSLLGASSWVSSRLDISQVDPELVGDTDTDRLSAGVARLLYNHIIVKAAAPCDSISSTGALPASSDGGSGSVSSGRSPRSPTSRLITSADFDEAQFLPKQRCQCCRGWRCRLRRTQRVSANAIFRLLQSVATISEFRKEVIVVGAIYVERLLDRNPELLLSSTNWRPVLVAALHLASKTWEDVHPWNAEVAAYLSSCAGVTYPARSLYVLESRFLSGLGYRVDVPGQVYASYFFSLQEEATTMEESRSGGSLPNSPNLSPHLGALGASVTLPRQSPQAGAAAAHAAPAAVAATLPLSLGPRAGGMVRSATWNHTLASASGTPSWRDGSEDSVPTTPVATQDSYKKPVSHDSQSSGWSSNALTNTTASTGELARQCSSSLEGSNTARKLRKQFQLDRSNPYIGSFRHAPRARAPSSFIKPRTPNPSFSTTPPRSTPRSTPVRRDTKVRK